MLSQGVCRVVLGPWNIELSGLMSESRYRECVVSYLAVAAGAGLGDFDYDFDRYAQFLERHKRIVETGLAGTPGCADSGTYHWLKAYHNARVDEDISRSDADAFVGACGRGMANALAPLRVA